MIFSIKLLTLRKSGSQELTLIWHKYHHRLKEWSNTVERSWTGAVGDNVAIPILMVDRGRRDNRNILSVNVHSDVETDQYKIAFKAGVLKG
jgi:hypothetical protein